MFCMPMLTGVLVVFSRYVKFVSLRKTSGEDWIQGLDLLRALAIAATLVLHYSQSPCPVWVKSLGRFGWIGVDLFFVLSGYLIGRQLLNQARETNQIHFRQFYLRRAFRILPSFFVVLALYFF